MVMLALSKAVLLKGVRTTFLTYNSISGKKFGKPRIDILIAIIRSNILYGA